MLSIIVTVKRLHFTINLDSKHPIKLTWDQLVKTNECKKCLIKLKFGLEQNSYILSDLSILKYLNIMSLLSKRGKKRFQVFIL